MDEKKLQDNSIKDVVESIDVFAFLSVQELLKAIYDKLKDALPRYSYRTFSRDLGFGETNYMHLICTQKRQLSPRSANQVVHHLGLHAERRQWFLSLVNHTGARRLEQRTAGIKKAFEIRQKTLENEFSRDEMEFFSKWYHPIVRELVGKQKFSSDPRWIANHLKPRISIEQAKQSLELLLRLGYIEQTNSGQDLKLSHARIRVPEGATHLAIHNYHREMLELSARSLSETAPESRDVSALSVGLNSNQIAEVKQMLRDVRKKIIELSEQTSQKSEIYQLNMQLFPVTEEEQ